MGKIQGFDGWYPAEALLDTGAQINLISEAMAKRLNLSKEIADLPKPQWLNGQTSYCYGAYKCIYQLTDSWRRVRECQGLFYSMDLGDTPLVLGMPALSQRSS